MPTLLCAQEASSAEAAIEEVCADGAGYGLVLIDDIFDVVQEDASSSSDSAGPGMHGSEAIGIIRTHERRHPRLHPAVIILCTGGDVVIGGSGPGAIDADAKWLKPFPDFTDATRPTSMQAQLARLLPCEPVVPSCDAPSVDLV